MKGIFFPFAQGWRLIWDLFTRGREVSRLHGLPLSRLLWDQLRLYRECGLGCNEYYLFQLWRPELSWNQKREYVGGRLMDAIWAEFCPPAYICLFQNKLIMKRMFLSAGLPVARLLAVYDRESGYTADGRPLRNDAEVREWLDRQRPDAFVMKPVDGMRGYGVLSFRRVDDSTGRLRYESPEGVVVGAEGLAERLRAPGLVDDGRYPDGTIFREAYLLEERIQPHPKLRPLSPHCCSHVRVNTIMTHAGDVEVLFAMYHVQGGRRSASNVAVYANVHLETGELGLGFVPALRRQPHLRADPETGMEFCGMTLPHWPEVMALARRAHRAFPWTRSAGWDIAIAENGPVLFEVNLWWGNVNIQVLTGHGLLQGAMLDLCSEARNKRLRNLARSLKNAAPSSA